MITDFLLRHPIRVWVALGIIAALCLGIGGWVLRHPQRGRRVAWAASGLALLPILALTFMPVTRQLYAVCVVQFELPTSLRVGDVLANLVLFVPVAWFATLASRRPLVMLVVGSLLSAAIEAVQAAIPAIGRSCDTNDWFNNTVGVAIGVSTAWAVAAWSWHQDRRRATVPVGVTPGPGADGPGVQCGDPRP
ncbi:MAG: VanZ family protein [Lapillicoccus sp.]